MKKGLFLKLLPHLIAVAVFLIVAVIYCRPALEGKVVQQHDITHWKGAIHQSQLYEEQHGNYPLWTNSLFSGMPAFQIGFSGNNVLPWYAHEVMTLWLPKPIQFFFLACVCFYFLCIVLRINPYIGMFGALAFAYATYNPVIISVGHDTKMLSIAYMPALLGSILMIFERRNYWMGAALTAVITSAMISMNHPQIDYYLFIALAIMSVFFIINWIKEKEYKHLVKAISFTIVAGLIGLLVNAVTFLSTYQYQKETIRGGSSEIADSSKGKSSSGLDKDYAFSYSMGMTEPFVMMVPRMFGGSSSQEEVKMEESKAVEVLRTLPQELQQQMPLSYYWGGMTLPGEVGVSGPVYVGAIICFLAIIAMFILDKKHKWWILSAIAFTIMISWGHYFSGFNSILYDYFPFYNKFRAPSMALVIPQMLLPLLAVLAVNKIAFLKQKQEFLPYFKKGLLGVGAVLVILFLMYMSFDFLSGNDKEILKRVNEANQPQLSEAVRTFFDALKEDRKSLMLGDIFRTLGFCLAGLAILYLMIRKMIKPVLAGVILSLIVLLDLFPINSIYLKAENYVEPDENNMAFQRSAADEAVLADKSYYRVFNVAGNAFQENITSYHYNSVGGYHAAKLRIYQDLIEKQLSQQQLNMPVFNMLNTKYFIQKNAQGVTENYQRNDSALGHAWFVKSVQFVKSANDEMQALNRFTPRDTAFMQEVFQKNLGNQSTWTGEGTIELVKNGNDIIEYKSASGTDQLAVFSEIYYQGGWKAFVDDKEVPISKVNYVLRSVLIPAGNHKIIFKFEPSDYIMGRRLTSIFTWLMVALILAGIYFEWRRNKQTPVTTLK